MTVSAARPRSPVITATVFLVALSLRPALTAVGPVLPRIGVDEQLGEGVLGLLGTLLAATGPVLAGYLAQRTGGWDTTLIVFAGLSVVQLVIGFAAGRDTRAARVSRP